MTTMKEITKETYWQKATIEPGDLFAFNTNSGWLVARAMLTEVVPYFYDRWPSITGQQASGPFSGASLPDAPEEATASRHILWHEYMNQIWQVFIGVSHPMIRFFEEYPLGDVHGAIRADIGNPNLQTTSISDFGWKFSGWESFMGRATVASMSLIPFKIDVGHGIFNITPYAKTPTTEYIINKIEYVGLDARDSGDAKLIRDVMRRRIRAIRWSPGTDGFPYRPGFLNVFGVPPVQMTARELFYTDEKGRSVPMEVD